MRQSKPCRAGDRGRRPVLLTPPALHAAPAREALVIGNGTYSTLPPLPACLLSAHAVAAALRSLGFDVVEREDASSGATDAAIGEFADATGRRPWRRCLRL